MQPPSKPSFEMLHQLAAQIRWVIFDVDGVLTDGSLHYGPHGEVMKTFDVKDGHGMVLSQRVGLNVALLTARTSEIVANRAKELGLSLVLQGQKDKRAGLLQLLAQANVDPAQVAYMGDDLNDLAPLSMVGLSACPADAVAEVRQAVKYVAQATGGHGAARELLDLVLKATGKWNDVMRLMC